MAPLRTDPVSILGEEVEIALEEQPAGS